VLIASSSRPVGYPQPVRHVVIGSTRPRVLLGRLRPADISTWSAGGGDGHAPTVTVTSVVSGAQGCVLVVIEWIAPGVTSVTLTRVHPDGTTYEVRNSPVVLTDGTAVFWDCEAPLNTDVYYIASSAQSTLTITTSTVNVVETEYGWLRDPLNPSVDVHLIDNTSADDPACDGESAVVFSALDTEAYESRTGVFSIVGAARPRTVSGVRGDVTSTLTLVSRQLADRAALSLLLASGRDLLLQLSTVDYGWATETDASDYITVGNVRSGRVNGVDMRQPSRVWQLPFSVVNAPADVSDGTVGSNNVGAVGARWDDLTASGLTWSQLAAEGVSWTEVSQGEGY